MKKKKLNKRGVINERMLETRIPEMLITRIVGRIERVDRKQDGDLR